MNLTKNFTSAEMSCKCCGAVFMDGEFMRALQRLRDIVKFPLPINSGFRCEKHNKKIGGAKHSRHLVGCAADISTKNLSISQIKTLKEAIKLIDEFDGVAEGDGFVHVDSRPGDKNVTWTY